MLPRPDLSDLLGIAYRRIPVLAIGNDVYCDTSLIAAALERRFPPSPNGYGTLFPLRKGGGKADTGMVKAFSQFYVDRMLFLLAAGTLDMGGTPEAFRKDRKDVSCSRCLSLYVRYLAGALCVHSSGGWPWTCGQRPHGGLASSVHFRPTS
jgi:glutathione S-transferase